MVLWNEGDEVNLNIKTKLGLRKKSTTGEMKYSLHDIRLQFISKDDNNCGILQHSAIN